MNASLQDVSALPIDAIDVSDATLYQQDSWRPYFARLRAEDPVHWSENDLFGGFWSVTRFEDITAVDGNHEAFSSVPAITIGGYGDDFPVTQFIAMDPPVHDVQRGAVQGVVAPRNLAQLEGLIRQRVGDILDDLPIGETFNWVEKVSINLTTQMLATIFDFPFEERHKLPYWSDMATSLPEMAGADGDVDAVPAGVADASGDSTVGIEIDLSRPELTDAVTEAVADRAQLRIEYYSPTRDEVAARVIDPRHVFADRGNWYVVAIDAASGERRTFRIDRIESLERTGVALAPLDDGAGAVPEFFADAEVPRVTLRLAPSATWVIDRYPHDAVEPAEAASDGSARVDVTLPVASEWWLARLLVRLGPAAEVLGDGDDADAGRQLASDILARYR